MISFFLFWPLLSILILICMSLDNIWWIPTSGDGELARKSSWKNYLIFIWEERLMTVYTSWRDIVPAVFTGLFLALIIYGFYFTGFIELIFSFIIAIIWVRYD